MDAHKQPYDLRPLQDSIFNVFKAFAAICQKHNLRYYAVYGTALGAVRHKGFIPWDDDFDVEMPRKDYESLKEYLGDELPPNLKFTDWSNAEGLAPLTFGKIQNADRDEVQSVEEKLGRSLSQGIYIDIFPLDGIPRSKWKILGIRAQSYLLLAAESSLRGIFEKISLKSWCWRLLGRSVRLLKFHVSDAVDVARERERLASRYLFEEYNNCGCIYGPYGAYREAFAYDVYGEGRMLRFRDGLIRVPDNFDVYLRSLYGDYMKPPPQDKQIPSHNNVPAVPWKFGPTDTI